MPKANFQLRARVGHIAICELRHTCAHADVRGQISRDNAKGSFRKYWAEGDA